MGQGFFPLDEELGLLPGNLTPLQQEHLVHLALWVSFPKAIKLLRRLMGVQVSEATARRQTEGAGAAYEAVQDEQASHLMEEPQKKSKKGRAKAAQPNQRAGKEPEPKLLLSSDGAMVPLVGGVWAEAKTVVIGQVKSKKKPCKQRAEQHVETVNLSYFSRLTNSETFGKLATVETERRGVDLATEVAAVQDGAEWIQGFVDLHRPDAVRILDFAHAAGYLSEIAELVRAADSPLPEAWLVAEWLAASHRCQRPHVRCLFDQQAGRCVALCPEGARADRHERACAGLLSPRRLKLARKRESAEREGRFSRSNKAMKGCAKGQSCS